ncbi:MAG: GLUG motif-containing protein [Rikenellaceae bacterium]
MNRLWSICAAMVLLFSCTESPEIADDITTTTPDGTVDGIPFSVTISMPQSESTRISSDYGAADTEYGNWAFTWDEDDAEGNVYAYCCYDATDENGDATSKYAFMKLTSSDLSSDSATFTGTIPAATTGYRILYKSDDVLIGGKTDPSSVTDGSASIDFNLGASTTFDDSNLANLVMISDLRDLKSSDDVVLKHLGSFVVLDVKFLHVQEHWKEVEIEDITYEGDIYVSTGENNTIPYWSASSETLLSDLTFDTQETTITYTPSTTTYAEEELSIPLYFNILPTPFGADAEATITISFSNGTKLVVTKTGSDGTTFARATFNTFGVTYESSDYDSAGTSDTEDYNTYSNTDANSLQYIFGSESSADTAVLFDEENPTSGTYYIWTEDHLAALAALANDGKIQDGGCIFMLKDDITITRSWWTPIGYKGTSYTGRNEHYNQHFAGVFDGNGKSISNYNTTLETDDDNGVFLAIGLFGYITTKDDDNDTTTPTTYPTTVVKNLTIKNGTSSLGDLGGRHVAILTATLEDAIMINCGCDSDCSATVGTRCAIGGLVGYASASHIYNSYNQGRITGTPMSGTTDSNYLNIGGICGATFSGGTDIYNCYNTGDITVNENGGAYYKGAIIGHENIGNDCVNVFYHEGVDPLGAVATTKETVMSGGTIDSNGAVTLLPDTETDKETADVTTTTLTAALDDYIGSRGGSYTKDDDGNEITVYGWTTDTYPTISFGKIVDDTSDTSGI